MRTLTQYSRISKSSNLTVYIDFIFVKFYFRSKIIYSLKPLPLCFHLIIKHIAITHEPQNNFTYLSSELIFKQFPFPIRSLKYSTPCQMIFNFQIHYLHLQENFLHFFLKTSKTSSAFVYFIYLFLFIHYFYLFIIFIIFVSCFCLFLEWYIFVVAIHASIPCSMNNYLFKIYMRRTILYKPCGFLWSTSPLALKQLCK